MLFKDWLSALHHAFATPPHFTECRRRKRELAVSAEVLEYRAAPSESILSLVGGGLLMGMLPHSPGGTSPPLMESFLTHDGSNGSFPSLSFSTRENAFDSPDEKSAALPRLSQAERGASSQILSQSPSTSRSQRQILPAVLDELLTSPLHESAVPFPNHLPRFVPTAVPETPIPDSAAPSSAGNLSSQSTSSGLGGNTHPGNADPNIGEPAARSDGNAFGSGGASSSAVPVQPPPRSHGEIQPLQIETQSKPLNDSSSDFFR